MKKTQQLRIECTIKRFLKFKWVEVVTFTDTYLNSAFFSRSISLFVQSQFFVTRQEFFQSYFAACSYQVNVLVAFLIIIEIPFPKCYLICSRKTIDLCIWLQLPSPFQPFYFSHNRTNTFLWGKWEHEGASWAINVQFLFFSVPVLQEAKWRFFLYAGLYLTESDCL